MNGESTDYPMSIRDWSLKAKIWLALLSASVLGLVAVSIAGFSVYRHYQQQLPSLAELKAPELHVPLRIYTKEKLLISEFGAERRKPIRYEQIPTRMVQAFLAAEDDRFFEHNGVDFMGLARAAVNLLRTGAKSQGGSTITMQLARNMFLTRERSYERKFKEILLAFEMEKRLSKQEILELYLNKIYLGQRAYGVGAAARTYYGRDIGKLRLAQIATIAGLPKAPSANNPISNPKRSMERRNWVLRRMLGLGHITQAEYDEAVVEPVTAQQRIVKGAIQADYVAEMVRADMIERFGEAAYTGGYQVITTLVAARQQAANRAMHENLLEYDQRHGYRGPEKFIKLDARADAEQIESLLEEQPRAGPLLAALVLEVGGELQVYIRGKGQTELKPTAIAWMGNKARFDLLFKRGDLIRVQETGIEATPWRVAQIPAVQGALVSIAARDGAIEALSGGFDYELSKFNRAVQAQRQPGSAFKPILYAAALEQAFTPASVINDAPVVFEDAALGTAWRPENYSGRFYGPTRLREGLVHSRNLVSIRLMQAVGIGSTIRFASQLGLPKKRMPADLSLSLGTATFTPLEMAQAYAAIANGGYRVEPYYIAEIRDAQGKLIDIASPAVACNDCVAEQQAPRVMNPTTAFLMTSIMQDVIRRGTGRRALSIGRNDLSGKTGTTNDQKDAWFCGFNGDVVTTAWVGFDQLQELGRMETGGRAALPMWIKYMEVALKGTPESSMPRPPGIASVRIDPLTGMLAEPYNPNAIFEMVQADRIPPRESEYYYYSDDNYGGGNYGGFNSGSPTYDPYGSPPPENAAPGQPRPGNPGVEDLF